MLKEIYIPKLKAKFNSPYLYAGEKNHNYRNFQQIQEQNWIFNKVDRPNDMLILGIESSFDESAACLINSFGEIKS